MNSYDRLIWITLRRFSSGWKQVLVIIKPDTVVAWHLAAFWWYWRWRSRRTRSRPNVSAEIRALIRRIAAENPD